MRSNKSRVVSCVILGALLMGCSTYTDTEELKVNDDWRTEGDRSRGITLPDGRPGLQYADAHKENRVVKDSWPCNEKGLFDGQGPDRCVANVGTNFSMRKILVFHRWDTIK